MRLLLQRVSRASVMVDGETIGSMKKGYLLFIAVMQGDELSQAEWLAQKVVHLRLFDGENGKINDQTLRDVGGEILVISQFTLAGSVENGNRPEYIAAAPPATAEPLYRHFIDQLVSLGVTRVQTGKFGAHMDVELVNDGPVTLWLEK
ncbi:D-tyrosyl-tRNA(Tyr) deacylase [Candidatus Peribacteria bacterium RIFCSPHIGHO2_01_FULL_51_9]|nr:MAG: D-tyrosyl-tRNA(Tyr) deacylase [Candidatus Peribacteria bacterium RIFCSPHIGHO2_01_FULL_51_9]